MVQGCRSSKESSSARIILNPSALLMQSIVSCIEVLRWAIREEHGRCLCHFYCSFCFVPWQLLLRDHIWHHSGSWCHSWCSTDDEEPCRWCCSQLLRYLHSVRRSVPTDALHTLVHAFISSRIDFYNMYGATDAIFPRLQAVLHAAAQLITGIRRNDHIVPTLRDALRVSAHYVQHFADDIRLYPWPITSVLPRHLFTDLLRSLSFLASLCWQQWHDCTTYSDRALWSVQFPRRGTPDLELAPTSSQEH